MKKLIQTYLKHLRDLYTNSSIPEETSLLADSNMTSLRTLLYNVNQSPSHRPCTPLIKQLTKVDIPLSSPFTRSEYWYIDHVIKVLKIWLGKPVYDYTKVDPKDYFKVDAWQSIAKISPKVTVKASERRYDKLLKLEDRKYVFSPNNNILKQAIQLTMDDIGDKDLQPNMDDVAAKGYFSAHASNVGFPFFRNETSTKDGTTYREIAFSYTKELLKRYGTSWIPATPIVIIGRDQQGGWEEFTTNVGDIKYKDSKARIVWAVPRIVTTLEIPFFKAYVNDDRKMNDPNFCGYTSLDVRKGYYKKHYEVSEDNGFMDENVDFVEYDNSLSQSMLSLAALLVKSLFKLDAHLSDIYDATASHTLFANYIAFDPYKKQLIAGRKTQGLPSGAGYTGLYAFFITRIIAYYGLITMYGLRKVKSMRQKYIDKGTFFITSLGDDLLLPFLSRTDVKQFSEIIKQDFNMDIDLKGTKVIKGLFFLQERYMPDGSIYYPLGRTMGNCLYTERPKGLGPATWDLTFLSKLYLLKDLPREVILSLTGLLMASSKTLLGLKDIEGNWQTPDQLLSRASAENLEHEKTIKETLWDGDPTKEAMYDEGSVKSDVIRWYYNLLQSALTYKGKYPSYQTIVKENKWLREIKQS